jgi:N-acetylneuraminic acid mutarotase
MKKTYLLLTVISLIMISCTKDFKEVKTIKEKENSITAAQVNCTGNNWQLDDVYYSGSARLVYNDKVYVFKHDVNKILIYNGTTWDTMLSAIPFTADPSFAFTIGYRAYFGCKIFQPSYQPEPYFWEYTFKTNTWVAKAAYPGPYIHNGATSFSVGNRGYVVGGYQYNGSPEWDKGLRDTWEYNPDANSWGQKANLPPFMNRIKATGFSIGDKGYIVNGQSYYGVYTLAKDLIQYDPVANQWQVKAPFPGDARVNTTVFVIDGKAYAGGGIDNNGTFKDFYKYNPTTNSWTQIAASPFGSRGGFSINSKGYVIFNSNNNTYGLLKYTPLSCFDSSPL